MFEGLKKGRMHFSYHLLFLFFYIQLINLCIIYFYIFNFFYFIFMRISPEAGLSDVN